MVLLAKPQFEAGRAEVDRGSGVIRDAEVWERALVEISRSVLSHGAAIMEGMVSPLTGTDGNVEFLLHVRAGAADDHWSTFDAAAVVALVDGGAACWRSWGWSSTRIGRRPWPRPLRLPPA